MPTTTNRKMSIPNTGADVGTWGSADLNPNFNILDSILGSVTTLNLVGAGFVGLTDAQQQVGVIRLTGGLTSNPDVQFSEPGFWIIDNQTTGNFFVTLSVTGSIENIATPQGARTAIIVDTSIPGVRFANTDPPGTYKIFGVGGSYPSWITACTVLPWIACHGGTVAISSFPALFNVIGTNFGGNGVTNFGIPDVQGRTNYDVDNGAGRITSTLGSVLGASGGDQFTQAHTHPFTGTNQNWNTNSFRVSGTLGFSGVSGGSTVMALSDGTTASVNITPAGTVGNSGSGGGQNIPPAIILGTTFIKT
jgi:microcystin-dependent protein